MKFTKAAFSDINELVDLLTILFEQEAEFVPNPQAQKKALGKIILDPKIGIVFVAKEQGQVVGMINLLFTESTALGAKVAILEDMVIHPLHRGLGIGTQLIEYVIQEAKKLECKRITLLTDTHNHNAHSLYKKMGFVASSMQPFRLMLN
jgi:GNAT superfamily N-acetyltransferase